VAIFQALYVGALFRVLVNGGRPTHGRLWLPVEVGQECCRVLYSET